MKVQISETINPFGGLNFVLEQMDADNIASKFNQYLPDLSPNSHYTWRDIFYSYASIFFCGGDCIEDSKTILGERGITNPFFKLVSPDTIQRRLIELSQEDQTCSSDRNKNEHIYNYNALLNELNVKLLDHIGALKTDQAILDYDNTIIFTKNKGSQMTYKGEKGFQPGVCFLNEDKVVYVENRNGGSGASAFQSQTLERIYNLLGQQGLKKVDKFRGDSASYQFSICDFLNAKQTQFYIAAPERYVQQYFTAINNWQKTKSSKGQDIWVGHTIYVPFKKRYTNGKEQKTYRLIVKKEIRKDGQINMITQEACKYRAIVTNDEQTEAIQALEFYNQRGAVEKQFDILKNDFGWKKPAFSALRHNSVHLILSAIVRNLYNYILKIFSKKYKVLSPKLRVKRFVFRFIAIPAKWIYTARQWVLKVYGTIQLRI